MDIETAATASGRIAVTAATGVSLWGMTIGDFGVGIIGVTTLVVTAFLKLYSEFREERRRQMSQDLELSKDNWKSKWEQAAEENKVVKTLVEIQREEIEILRKRVNDLSTRDKHEPS